MIIVIYLILGIVYLLCPKHIKVVSCVINLFVPDPIPGIDEVVMIAGLLM